MLDHAAPFCYEEQAQNEAWDFRRTRSLGEEPTSYVIGVASPNALVRGGEVKEQSSHQS